MPINLNKVARAEFKICADGPVLISSKYSGEIDPTKPDIQFLQSLNGNESVFVIPGSTIKGVIRNFIENDGKLLDNISISKLFGTVKNNGDVTLKSRISFHDAYANMSNIHTTFRNSTAIHPHTQAALGTSLNNVIAVDKGSFNAGFTIVNFSYEELYAVLNALEMANVGFVRFGGRKSRGYGKVRIEDFELTIIDGFTEDMKEKISCNFENLDKAASYFKGVH